MNEHSFMKNEKDLHQRNGAVKDFCAYILSKGKKVPSSDTCHSSFVEKKRIPGETSNILMPLFGM